MVKEEQAIYIHYIPDCTRKEEALSSFQIVYNNDPFNNHWKVMKICILRRGGGVEITRALFVIDVVVILMES